MTPEDLDLLHRAQDMILAVELNSGEQFFAEIVMVVDQPPTPDVFLLRIHPPRRNRPRSANPWCRISNQSPRIRKQDRLRISEDLISVDEL